MKNSTQIPKRLLLAAFLAGQLLNSAQAAVDLGVVQTSTIGHVFFDPNTSPPFILPRSAVDYLVDHDQGSGGGGLLPSVSVNWDTNTQFTIVISAPPGQKFSVQVPPGRAVGFGGYLWWESTRGGFSPSGPVAVSFNGLEGTPPDFSGADSALSDSHGFFGIGSLEGSLVSNSFAFTSIRLTGTVTPQFTGNGTENYVPHHHSSLQLYYQTPQTNDPGRFVFIVPAGTNSPSSNAIPIVNWLQPTNGATFSPGNPVLLRATASDPEGSLSTVDFFAGSNLLRRISGTLTNGVYSFLWSNAPTGTHQLRAEATDNLGVRGISSSVQIVVNGGTNTPPTNNALPVVNWVRPTNGAVIPIGSPITLTANATDVDGTVSFVEFFSGSFNLGRGTKVPTNSQYNLIWSNAPAGMHQMHAEAVDNAGGRGVSASVEISVTAVTNTPPSNAVPVVNWIRPTNGSAFSAGASIMLTASASDADGTISFVDFFAGSVNLGRVNGPITNGQYNLVWSNAPAGTHQMHAEAADNAGARGISGSVQIVVIGGTNTPPTNNALPVVNWFRPTNGTIVPVGTPIILRAHATDPDGTISLVEFFAGSVNLGRGIKAPTNSQYSLAWSNARAGVHQLRAEAVDNSGGRAISASVQIIVGAPASGIVDLGTVETRRLGHAFVKPALPMPPTPPNVVIDFLVDQDESSGGGGMLPTVSVNWDTHNQFKLTVSAPPNNKFVVAAPPGRLVRFDGFLWWESTRGGISPPGDVAVTFTDLEGNAPRFDESDSVLSDSHGFFGFMDLEGTGVSNSFSFKAITLTGTVTPQYTGNGTENYVPHLESSMQLYYLTTETNDPGSFVSIVPANAPPIIRLISTLPGSGVSLVIYGQAGRTHIVECSPDTVTWIPISSAVMPAAGSMPVSDASAASAGSRFYRVVEVP